MSNFKVHSLDPKSRLMLHQDQDIFNVLLEAVSEGVIIVDDQQRVMEVNEKAEKIFGYHKGELLQKDLTCLIRSCFQDNYLAYFEELIKQGGESSLASPRPIYGKKKNGDQVVIELKLKPFTIYDKSYVMGLVKDISEERQIEKDLMLKSSALESATNGIVITDARKKDNPIIYFNSAFEKLTGYSRDEIINHNCRFLQGNDRKQVPFKIIRDAIEKGESSQVTVRNYKKDGTLFWNNLYLIPIINNEGVLTNFIGIQNDVTAHKKLESERNHFANIFHESLNEIYVFDAKTLKFLNVNFGAKKNLGYTLNELLEKTPLDLISKIDEIKYRKILKILTDRKLDKLEFETTHQRKDGSSYPVEVHVQLSRLGEDYVFVAIVLDITESKNYTEELEIKVHQRTEQLNIALSKEKELNELKTQFLSLVAHEFKTPLSGILTSAVLLGKYTTENQQQKRDKHIKTISDKVYYLNAILNDFLSLEKLESGKVSYNFKEFKLSKVIDEVIYNANMLLKEGQSIRYPDNINEISLYQDEKIIALVLTNLVHNAIKYSLEHSQITIVVNQTKNFTTIQVVDEGIGIPLIDQKNIFDRYFRARNVLNIQGTGVGLNIVKDNIQNLGGNIVFESKENEGSIFTVVLPNTAKQ